jgi:hypothetical protein
MPTATRSARGRHHSRDIHPINGDEFAIMLYGAGLRAAPLRSRKRIRVYPRFAQRRDNDRNHIFDV